jgi:hypothetical protein
MIETAKTLPDCTRHPWRAVAVAVLACFVVLWVVFAWAVWAITILIISFRHDGIADGDRVFLALAPAGVLLLAPTALAYLGAFVLAWRRPGWWTAAASFGLGSCAFALAASTAVWLGFSA